MLKYPRVWEARIARAVALMKDRIYTGCAGLEVEALQVEGEPGFPARVPETGFEGFKVGERWGKAWGTIWFRFSGVVPVEWSGRNVVALVRLGYDAGEGFTSEGLVWQEGRATRAINVNRADVPVAAVAKGGERVSFLVEAAANPTVKSWAPYSAAEPVGDGPLFALEQAELACFDAEAFELHQDLALAYEAMMTMPQGRGRWRGRLLRVCNEAVNVLDPEDASTYGAARTVLREVLDCKNGDQAHEISAVGHAHIDTAWLWPLREITGRIEGLRYYRRTAKAV